MPFSLSPSVSVTEKDLSTIISNRSTTQACFVGRFEKGPVDEIVSIDSEQKLHEVFGGPVSGERGQDWWVCANYLSYSNNLKIVRLPEGDSLYYNSTQGGLTAAFVHQIMEEVGVKITPSGHSLINNTRNHGIGGLVGATVWGYTGALIYAKDPGTEGNSLRLVVHPAYTDNPYKMTSAGASGQSFPIFGDEENMFSYHPVATTKVFDSNQSGILTGGATQDEVHFAVIDQTGILSTHNQPGVTGTILEKFEGLSMWKGVIDQTGRNIYYKDYINAYSNYINIEENTNRSIFFPSRYQETGSSGGDPTWTRTSRNMPYPLGFASGFSGGSDNGTDRRRRGVTAAPFAYNAEFVNGAQAGGTSAYDGKGSNSNMTIAGNPNVNAIKSMYRKHFRDPEKIDIDIILGGGAEGTVAKELISIAEFRKDCIVFLSPPASPAGTEYEDISNVSDLTGFTGPQSTIDYVNAQNFNSSYAFMDDGWKYQYDSYNDMLRWIPLNGDIAGIVSRAEFTNPYNSPAGLSRGRIQGVVKLSSNLTTLDKDRLYASSINPTSSIPGEGAVLWGDKTLNRRATDLDRIHIRRLLITLEKAIATSAKYQLFEINDAWARRSFISTITPFLRSIKSQGGIVDYQIVCDETNNNSSVVADGRFVADIFIKPTSTTQYVGLNFSSLRSSATFNESIV